MSSDAMTGEELRGLREARGLNQQELAELLNEKLGRRYDRNRISRWETGAERIPQLVVTVLRLAASPASTGIPALHVGPAMILAVSNQKGGVGKTVSVANVGFLLARAGKRVLIVDSDPQASISIHLGVDPHECELSKASLSQVLFNDRATREAIVPVCDEQLDLLACSIDLADADANLAREPNGTLVLREKLDEVRDDYDFILVDCPPNLGVLTVSALNAADQLLIPSQTEMLSLMGIPKLLENVAKVRRRVNPRIGLLGILPTLFKARRVQDQAMLEELRKLAAANKTRLFSPVKDVADIAKGVTAGRPALELNPHIVGAEAYHEVAGALLSQSVSAREDVRGAA
jgi:chromosome partitioning protein